MAKAILDICRRFPGRLAPRFNGPVPGGVAVAEVYIYPSLPASPQSLANLRGQLASKLAKCAGHGQHVVAASHWPSGRAAQRNELR